MIYYNCQREKKGDDKNERPSEISKTKYKIEIKKTIPRAEIRIRS